MKLLIIDDEQKLANNLKKLLENELYLVDVAYNGEIGYEYAAVNSYDLIILDLGLPDISGFEVCKRLRNEDHLSIPILMLTARDAMEAKIEGLNIGADDYIVKPFNFDELLARIKVLLRRNTYNTTNEYAVDNLVLNTQTKTITRNSKTINLSAKEYSLLEYLMMKKDHTLSKSQLIEHVWDSDIDPFSNVVDVYIGYIRTKVDKNFPKEKPLIHTIKGVGYKIGVQK